MTKYHSEAVDALDLYLTEASHSLLTQEEEQALACQMCAGRAARNRLEQGDPLPDDALLIEQGRLARQRLIESNLRLVISIAKRFQGRGLSLEDLIAEGNAGLITAVDKFDPERGVRLTTYAYAWIAQGIRRALDNQGDAIRVPCWLSLVIARLITKEDGLVQALERPPTDAERAEAIGASVSRVRLARRAHGLIRNCVSLDQPLRHDDERDWSDVLADAGTVPVPEQAVTGVIVSLVRGLDMDALEPREARVLRLRYGLDGEREHSNQEIGAKFDLTRERIRQIGAKALRKLRELPEVQAWRKDAAA